MLTDQGQPAGLTANMSMAWAVSELHARHYVSLVRLARTLVDSTDSAEEVVQDAFERLIRRWGRLHDVQAMDSYLRRCVVNGCRDRIRRRVVRRTTTLETPLITLSAEDRALLSDQQQRVLDAVRRLPPRQRDVLLLRYFAQLSEAEVADALDVSKGTVKSNAHKGIAALRALAAKEAWQW